MRSNRGSSAIVHSARDAAFVADLQERFDALTSREREAMSLVVTGRANKQVAADLQVSEMTVKIHRSQVIRKMRAKSLIELARMADKLGISMGTSSEPKPKT